VSTVYGTQPGPVIASGHGLQPIWRTDLDPKTDVALLRMHGRLVRSIAAEHGVKLDSVFDLARVLRMPGTTNHKYPDAPVPTSVTFGDGRLLRAAELHDRLQAAGVDKLPGDDDMPGEVISTPDTWPFTGQWCRYAQVATENWVKDELDERHNGTGDRYVRLACLWRYGCLPDETTLQTALDALAERLRQLREQTGQTVGHGECQRWWFWALDRVSGFTDERVAAEVKHTHGDGGQFFGKGGLLVLDLGYAVKGSVTCGFDELTERFYVYDGGVWRSDRSRIEEQIVALLGNRYRTSHVKSLLDVIRFTGTPRLDPDDPLSDYINVANGMVDWTTGALVDHNPKFLSTVQLPHDYEPDADCPAVLRFLTEVLPTDCVESGFIWELIGYTMYSGNPLHIAALLWGKGRNGKGTLIRLLKALIGVRNCSAVGLHELTENRFRAATLYGKLANLAGDLPARWVANTAMFKAITGDDTIQGEHKYGPAFDFTPWALPVYSANKAFGSADSSEGWWSRWLVIPFPRTFAGREDRKLDTRLQTDAELAGVMARGIAALPALMARGRFLEPASVQRAKQAFIIASDAVRGWIDECCVLDPGAWTPRPQLYDAYVAQTMGSGAKTLSRREFYNRIEQIGGIVLAKRDGYFGYKGIKLRHRVGVHLKMPFPPSS
jgi:P4 family phage/plasmid primase-like protien